MLGCNNAAYQGYGHVGEKCVSTAQSLPFTGTNLALIVLGGFAILAIGALLHYAAQNFSIRS